MKHEPEIHEIPSHHAVFTRLTGARMAWALTIETVASRMGCEPETLRKYELGVRLPSLSALLRWASALGYDLSLWPKEES